MIYIFGKSLAADQEINRLNNDNYSIVDNNPTLWGTKHLSKIIQSPEILLQDENITSIIICSSSFLEIKNQLINMGIPETKINFSNMINNFTREEQLYNFKFKGLISSGLPSKSNLITKGGIYELAEIDNKLNIKNLYSGNTRAMTIHEDKLFFSSLEDGLVTFDLDKKNISNKFEFSGELKNPHGIKIHDGYIYVSFSKSDCISKFDFKGKEHERFYLSNLSKSHKEAIHHCNDIEIIDHELFVSMFSVTGHWKKGIFNGGVKSINLKTKEVTDVISKLKMPHNIKYFDNTLFVLNSYQGEMLGYDQEIIAKLNGFVRGFDIVDDFFIIGESKNRNISLLNRGNLTASLDTRISIIDKNINISRSIPLPRYVSEIHSIINLK